MSALVKILVFITNGGLKKTLHNIMVIVAYALLLLDYILKNPPPIPLLGK